MEIKLEYLWVVCPKCKGAKGIATDWSTGNPIGITGGSTVGPCDECSGQGGKFTKNGEALNQFIRVLKSNGNL